MVQPVIDTVAEADGAGGGGTVHWPPLQIEPEVHVPTKFTEVSRVWKLLSVIRLFPPVSEIGTLEPDGLLEKFPIWLLL